jgi:ferritin
MENICKLFDIHFSTSNETSIENSLDQLGKFLAQKEVSEKEQMNRAF